MALVCREGAPINGEAALGQHGGKCRKQGVVVRPSGSGGCQRTPGEGCREEGTWHMPAPSSAQLWVQPAVLGSGPCLPGSGRAVLSGCPAGSEVAPAKSGRGLLPQEEGNAGRMSSPAADKSFPMNPC